MPLTAHSVLGRTDDVGNESRTDHGALPAIQGGKIQMNDSRNPFERQLFDEAGSAGELNSSTHREPPNASGGQESRQCTATKSDGGRCGARTLTGSLLCFFHDPASAEERTAASRRGGQKNRAAVLPPETPDFPLNGADDASALLGRAINLLLRGELDPKIANAVGYLLTIKIKTTDLGKLEERMAALEAALKEKAPEPNLFDPEDDLEGL